MIKFNNVTTFELPTKTSSGEDFVLPMDGELNELLSQMQIFPCGAHETFRQGFVPFSDEQYFLTVNEYIYLIYQENTKKIPPSVIRDRLIEAVENIEKTQERKVGRKEKIELKERIVFELLPSIIQSSKRVSVIIDTNNNLVHVGDGSANKSEDVCGAIRKAIGTFPVKHKSNDGRNYIGRKFSNWIVNDLKPLGQEFMLGDSCEISLEETGKVKISGTPITSENVVNHLVETSAIPTRINLFGDDGVTFDLNITETNILSIKKLKVGDIDAKREELGVGDDSEYDENEQKAAEIAADVIIYGSLLKKLWGLLDTEFNN